MEMELENIMVREITQKDKDWVFLLTCRPRDLLKVDLKELERVGSKDKRLVLTTARSVHVEKQ